MKRWNEKRSTEENEEKRNWRRGIIERREEMCLRDSERMKIERTPGGVGPVWVIGLQQMLIVADGGMVWIPFTFQPIHGRISKPGLELAVNIYKYNSWSGFDIHSLQPILTVPWHLHWTLPAGHDCAEATPTKRRTEETRAVENCMIVYIDVCLFEERWRRWTWRCWICVVVLYIVEWVWLWMKVLLMEPGIAKLLYPSIPYRSVVFATGITSCIVQWATVNLELYPWRSHIAI